ncbi:20271_t:CDS:2, partial [Racocetra persica]
GNYALSGGYALSGSYALSGGSAATKLDNETWWQQDLVATGLDDKTGSNKTGSDKTWWQ